MTKFINKFKNIFQEKSQKTIDNEPPVPPLEKQSSEFTGSSTSLEKTSPPSLKILGRKKNKFKKDLLAASQIIEVPEENIFTLDMMYEEFGKTVARLEAQIKEQEEIIEKQRKEILEKNDIIEMMRSNNLSSVLKKRNSKSSSSLFRES